MLLSKNKTLIILDWDDTLFPTTWITTNQINLKNNIEVEKHKNYFNQIDIDLYNLLKKLMRCGKVIIVTNALLNWIQISTAILPRTMSLLDKIVVISARGDYQSKSNNPMDWKKMAFKREVELLSKNKKINNIISIGDAEYEYNALINLYNKNTNNYRLLKAVKFKRYPNIYEIDEQIDTLNDNIINICIKPAHLDLYFREI